MLPAVGSSPRAGGVPPSKAVVSPTPARARFSIGAEVDALRFLRATPAPGSHPLLRLIALLQTGSLTQLYGKPFNLPESRDGPHFGSHAVGRIATPRSVRAPEPTWWDAPSAPQPQPQYPQEAGGLGSAKQPLYTYQVEMPAMAYQASVLEERMLLAAFKRRRNELVEPPMRAGRSMSARGMMSSRAGSAFGSEKNFWPPARSDPWVAAVTDHNLEKQALHQASLRDFENKDVQKWLVDKQAEMRKPTGQGRDQMDPVMFFLATGREAVHKAGGGEANLADINDAFANQKKKKLVNSTWEKKIEATNKDLQWISKYRQREASRSKVARSRRDLAGEVSPNPPVAVGAEGNGEGLSLLEWAEARAAARTVAATERELAMTRSASIQSLKAAAAAEPEPTVAATAAPEEPAVTRQISAQPQAATKDWDEVVDGEDAGAALALPTPVPPLAVAAPAPPSRARAVPSYMAPNEAARRRGDGFCRGRAMREQMATR